MGDKYLDSYMGEKDGRPCYTGPGRAKGSEMVAMVVVGSGSTDPQKFTKDYCGLFTDSGVMPKRHLARFPVTSNSVIQPGTPLTASHFTIGQDGRSGVLLCIGTAIPLSLSHDPEVVA